MTATDAVERGSLRLREAWKHRVLTEEGIEAIAKSLDESSANVESVVFSGGDNATGVTMSLVYDADDIPRCGNDLASWLAWHRKFGGGGFVPPRIFTHGILNPELVRIVLTYGSTAPAQAPRVEVPGFTELR